MLLKNNEDRIHNLLGQVVLTPGINDVDDALWNGGGKDAEGQKIKGMKDHSGVKRLLDAKVIEIVKKPEGVVHDTGTTPAGQTDLGDYPQTDQLRMVGETFDRALLTRWDTTAKDKAVKDAIDKQLAAIGLTEEERESALKKKR